MGGFFGLPYDRALCCVSCLRFVSIDAGRNLFGAVELADQWYLTAYPATGWQRSWFATPISSGPTVEPDFAVEGATVAAPNLVDGGTTYRCVGVSGSQYGDASRVPGMHGDSCVWYQLNYRPLGDSESKPVAALARVAVRDDLLTTQISDPLNRKFELTHCWLLKDENGDPWYFDAEAKLCHYHDTSRKTLVGPGHFAYQYLRQTGDVNQLRYWTPGVAQAVFTEWDNPNTTVNTTGWKALFFDANCFPVALGTRASTITMDGANQVGHRDLICGMGNPASGVVDEVEQWTDEDAIEGTQHLRVESSVGGTGGGWPTLTQDDLLIEVNDWAFFGGAGDVPLYYPDDEDEEFPVEAFDSYTNYNNTGRYAFHWAAQTFQRSAASRFDEGFTVSVETDPSPSLNLKGISTTGMASFARIAGNAEVSAGSDGSDDCRISAVPTNSWCAASSSAPEHTGAGGFPNPAQVVLGHQDIMYDQTGYLVEKPGEDYAGQGEIIVTAPVRTVHVTSQAPFRTAPEAKEDLLGWYYEFIPPRLRALVRLPAAVDISPDSQGAAQAWVISHTHQVESLSGDPSYIGPAPSWQKALWIETDDTGDDDIHVSIRGVYWPTSGEPENAPISSFAYAGVED